MKILPETVIECPHTLKATLVCHIHKFPVAFVQKLHRSFETVHIQQFVEGHIENTVKISGNIVIVEPENACYIGQGYVFGMMLRDIHVCPENCLQVSGTIVEAAALAEELKRTADVLGEAFGGFTFSGGEPLMQPEFLLELTDNLKGYHLCMETSGYADEETFIKIVSAMDLVIMDIKIADDELHQSCTGVSNKKILRNFEFLRSCAKPYIVRTPLIPGICDTEDNLSAIKDLIGDSPWEKLPYNQMAGAKYEMLNMKYPMNK